MQIFYLDENPGLAARAYFDTHVRKILVEATQMLSTYMWKHDCSYAETLYTKGEIYLPTHENHPLVKWVLSSPANYNWIYKHANHLVEEYYHRFGKAHKSRMILCALGSKKLEGKFTQPPNPKGYTYHSSVVSNYREYYRTEKAHLAKWTFPGIKPVWF